MTPVSLSVASAAVVLAAGAGRRLGGVAKAALCLADQRTYLQAIRDAGTAAGITAWVVVVGPPHDQVTGDLARDLGLPVVHNPTPERGMASSVALGFAHAERVFLDHQVALLWPVDHPLVAAETVRAILDCAAGDRVIIPTLDDRGGHPSAVGRQIWPELAQCHDLPEGARSVLRARPARVRRLALDDPGLRLDVDTPAARAQVAQRSIAGCAP